MAKKVNPQPWRQSYHRANISPSWRPVRSETSIRSEMVERAGENSNQNRSHRFLETTAAKVSCFDGSGISLREKSVAERVGQSLLAKDTTVSRPLRPRHRRLERSECREIRNGGEGGIRTHGTLTRSLVFKTSAFDHSATSPVPAVNVA